MTKQPSREDITAKWLDEAVSLAEIGEWNGCQRERTIQQMLREQDAVKFEARTFSAWYKSHGPFEVDDQDTLEAALREAWQASRKRQK